MFISEVQKLNEIAQILKDDFTETQIKKVTGPQ